MDDLSLQEAMDTEIYSQDTAWLRESDVVIAACANPSLGVGYDFACVLFLCARIAAPITKPSTVGIIHPKP